MNTLRNLIFGAVALTGLALATPAQAHGHGYYHGYYGHGYYHGHGYWGGGPVVTFGGGPYYSDPYYAPYYYPPYYGYGYAPGVSFGFGGHGWYGHHYYHHWHR